MTTNLTEPEHYSRGIAEHEIARLIDPLTGITERKRTAAALVASELSYRRLFESARDGILILDAGTGMIVDVNPFLIELLGFSRDAFLGMRLWDLGFFKDIIANQESFAQLQRDKYLRYDDKPLETADGRQIDVEFVSNVYLVDGREVIQCNIRDITQRKHGLQEQARLEAELQRSRKMASVGRLAGGVAHDFNSMLAVILGRAELALKMVDPKLPLHADLMDMLRAAVRMANLTSQLLAFAGLQTIVLKVVNLNDSIASMLRTLQPLIGVDVTLRWLPAADLWPVKIDPSQVDHIMVNLCVNARDAMPGIGRISIETKNSTLDADYCVNHAEVVAGEYVQLSVSDDGCGLQKDMLSQVFEPFSTNQSSGKGTGLGLATVYGIVRQNGGTIDVDSEWNRGTTFTIYLPRHLG